MERWRKQIEAVVKTVPGTTSAYAERITGGYYLDIEPDRMALARYGLAVGELQDVIGTALGGEMVTTTVEGRERFGVSRALSARTAPGSRRRSPPRCWCRPWAGAMIPLGQVAQVQLIARAPPGIRTENALLSAYIFVDIRDRDIGGYVADAQKAVREQVKFPPGYYATWSGQFEYMERAKEKLKIVVPLTLLIIFVLLYLNFRRLTETLIVMLSVPFALVGGVWLMWLLGYNLSVAVAVGFIALAGVAAETGVVMLIYLDQAWEAVKAQARGRRRHAHAGRPLRRGHGRRGGARAAEDDDRGRDHGGPAAHHVGQRHRLRSHAPHRRADGGRHDFLDRADADRDSGDLRAGERRSASARGTGRRKMPRQTEIVAPAASSRALHD